MKRGRYTDGEIRQYLHHRVRAFLAERHYPRLKDFNDFAARFSQFLFQRHKIALNDKALFLLWRRLHYKGLLQKKGKRVNEESQKSHYLSSKF